MEQNYTSIMLMSQAVVSNLTSTAGIRSADAPKESFKDLMERQKGYEAVSTAGDDTSTKPKEDVPVIKQEIPVGDDAITQEQIIAAAMATMQNPVVVMDQSNAPVVTESGTVQFAAPVSEQVSVAATDGGADVLAGAKATSGDGPAIATESKVEGQQLTHEMEFGKDKEITIANHRAGERAEVEVDESTQQGDVETPVFREVKEVMVKVGDASVSAEVKEAVPVNEQIGKQVSAALERGESQITVQLTPQNLGRVEIELTHAKDGSLRVTLRAENQATQQLLEKESVGLQTVLMRNSQQEVSIEVSRQQESHQQNFEDGRQGQHHNPQQEHKEQKRSSEDFLHQLRLGLIPLGAEAS